MSPQLDRSQEDVRLQAIGLDEAAATEALAQIVAIQSEEDDRRRSVDAKLSSAQSALAFTVALAGGSAVFAFLQTPQYDLWHLLSLTCLVASVTLFVTAAWKITAANDPRQYQMRRASPVREMLKRHAGRRELLADVINDLVCNIDANIEQTNTRLTLYMKGSLLVRWAIIMLALVPLTIFVGYVANLSVHDLPNFLRNAPSPLVSQSPSPMLSPLESPSSNLPRNQQK